MSPSAPLDPAHARTHFPVFSPPAAPFIFADNAGGTQCLGEVALRVSDYLLTSNVMIGADYPHSRSATARIAAGTAAARELLGAEKELEVVFGSSSTLQLENLSRAMDTRVRPGDEIVVTYEHEANVGPWKHLAARTGAVLKYWDATPLESQKEDNPYAVGLQIAGLLPLITPRTRLVAFTACSNILGTVNPVADIVRAIRTRADEVTGGHTESELERGGRRLEVCVDCVAYAPHRPVSVKEWDVDYAVFSMYKVFGPHISVMYAREASLARLSSLAHDFHALDKVADPLKLAPGGPGYELIYGCSAVPEYLRSLSGGHGDAGKQEKLAAAWAAIAAHETLLADKLLGYLRSKHARGVRVVGDAYAGPARAPTVSFVVVGARPVRSRDVVAACDAKGDIGIRYGSFYAPHIVERLGIDRVDGVVRISLVHYNTMQEVDTIIAALEEALQ